MVLYTRRLGGGRNGLLIGMEDWREREREREREKQSAAGLVQGIRESESIG